MYKKYKSKEKFNTQILEVSYKMNWNSKTIIIWYQFVKYAMMYFWQLMKNNNKYKKFIIDKKKN